MWVYWKHWDTLILTVLVLKFEKVYFSAGWVAKSEDTDPMPHSVAYDLGLQRLLKPVCPNI